MGESMMDISGSPACIAAKRAQYLGWPKALCELIDNAMDAGASEVVLDFSTRNTLEVKDNGCGCRELRNMLADGHRQEHGKRNAVIGRHGVGAKDAFIWISGATSISSTHDGITRRAAVDWFKLQAQPQWLINAPVEMPAGTGERGTVIRLSRLNQDLPSSWPDLLSSLGAVYEQALRSGIMRIAIKTAKQEKTVAVPDEVDLDHVERAALLLAADRTADVRMGIISSPEQRNLQGVTIAMRAGRVLRQRTRIGIGTDPTPGLYAYVILDGKWGFSRNKDGIESRHEDELARAVAGHAPFQRLIEVARRGAEDVQIADANNVLGLLHGKIRGLAKAMRGGRTGKHGTIIPKGTGRVHRRASVEQPGDRFLSETLHQDGGRSLQIVRENRGDSPELLTLIGSAVHVNVDHPLYRQLAGNMDVIQPLAVLYFAATKILDRRDGLLPCMGQLIKEDETGQVALANFSGRVLGLYTEALKEARGLPS